MKPADLDLENLPQIPRKGDTPVFREPWEARAFAMAVKLNERGLFTWSEWAETLGAEIKSAQASGDADLEHIPPKRRRFGDKDMLQDSDPGAISSRENESVFAESAQGDTYYLHWLAALEKLVTGKQVTSGEKLTARKEAWERAALATPHGEPIELGRDGRPVEPA